MSFPKMLRHVYQFSTGAQITILGYAGHKPVGIIRVANGYTKHGMYREDIARYLREARRNGTVAAINGTTIRRRQIIAAHQEGEHFDADADGCPLCGGTATEGELIAAGLMPDYGND